MKFVFRYLFVIICGLFPAIINAQENTDKVAIYKLLLSDLFISGTIDESTISGIVDSTCNAVFYGGFPDSINKRYFGYTETDFLEVDLFRLNFISATSFSELIPADTYSDRSLVKIPKKDFRKCFSLSRHPREIILSDKGFKKLANHFRAECFCECSAPFFINSITALIYCHYQCGIDNSFSNVFLLLKGTKGWEVKARLRNWG